MLKKVILFLSICFIYSSCSCNPFRRLSDAVKRKRFEMKMNRCRENLIESGYREETEVCDEEEIYCRKKSPSSTSSYVDSEPKPKENKENVYVKQLSEHLSEFQIVINGDKFNEILTVKDCLLSVEYFLLNNNVVYAWFYLSFFLDGINKFIDEENSSDLNTKMIVQLLCNFLLNLNNQPFLEEALKHELFA